MNRAEIKEMMDRKERMDMVKKIAVIREAIEETRRSRSGYTMFSAVKHDTIIKSFKNYCRESWLYRALEFIGLR